MGSEEQDVQDRSRGQARDTDASEAFVEQWYLRSEVSVIRWRIEALVGHRKGLARRTGRLDGRFRVDLSGRTAVRIHTALTVE